jgi:hypothetical protein
MRSVWPNSILEKGILVTAIALFMVVGCGSSPKSFDPSVSGPQLIVDPDTIRTGVAKVMGTEIVFKGKGFQPKDSVFIELVGVKKEGKEVKVPIADSNVDEEGMFTAEVSTLVKVSEILRAKLGYNEEDERVIIVTQPPIPSGTYLAKAVSMEADITAETRLVIEDPSFVDKVKDWIGGIMGKIQKK